MLGGDYFLFDQKPGAKHADKIKDFIDGVDLILLRQSKFDWPYGRRHERCGVQVTIQYAANGWLKYDGQKFAKLPCPAWRSARLISWSCSAPSGSTEDGGHSWGGSRLPQAGVGSSR